MSKETHLRQYRIEDIPEMLPEIEAAHVELPVHCMQNFDHEKVRGLLANNVSNDNWFVCYVLTDAETGAVVGGVGNTCAVGYSSYDLYSTDILLFIKPEWRTLRNAMKLILASNEWALRRGVKPCNIRSTVTNSLKLEGMTKLLQRAGFRPIGTIFMYDPDSRGQVIN